MNKALSLYLLFFTIFNYHVSFAAEDSTYNFKWLDPDKEVYVLQNRKFRKDGRVYVSFGAGMTTSGAFVDALAYQFRAGYFITEEWGFELLYSKNSGEENDTALSLRNEGASGSVPFRRIVDSYTGGMVIWSPFYSKINTFNKIFYYDVVLGAGLVSISETNNKDEFLNGAAGTNEELSETHTGFLWDIGIKFFITQSFDLRIDLLSSHYQAQAPSNTTSANSWYTNHDLTVSVGYSF